MTGIEDPSPLARALAGLLCAGALSAATWALSPQEPRGALEEANDERGANCLVHLADGRVLRQRARNLGESWEVRHGQTWSALPEGQVETVKLEKEVLARARRLEKEMRGGGPTRQVAYCDWLVREGLHVEALEKLDHVLAEDPDQADALALLERAPLPRIRLPELADPSSDELEQFFSSAARLGPSGREIAIGQLREVPEITGLIERLESELVNRSEERRSLATLVLRRMFPGRRLQPLLSRAILDVSPQVREGAAYALRDVGDPAVILPVVRALGSENHRVRSHAAQALGTMSYAAAVEPLMTHLTTTLSASSGGSRAPHTHILVGRQLAYIQDFDVEVASGESIADPVVNVLHEGTVLDAAVLGVTEYHVQTERAGVRRSLARLTGARPGNTTTAWKRWWEKHGDEWKAGEIPSGPVSSSRGPAG